MLIGAQRPRICVIPPGAEHPRWQEVVEFIRALGITLDEWQLLVLHSALLREAKAWAAFAVAVCAPRQNGKNGILEVRELIGPCLLGEPLAIHTAHLADTSKEAFRRLDDILDGNEWLSKDVKHIWRTNGHESIEFKGGRRIRFRTRTRGGGRGFSGSPVFFDEAMFLPEVSMGSIMPVISAQPDPQIWYMGSAVDQAIMEDGAVFARVRDRALSGDASRLAYFEWSLDYATPDLVPVEVMRDPASAAATNPAYGIRITPAYLEAEQRELDPRTLAVERFGVGDWPNPDAAKSIIDLDKWLALTDASSTLKDPVCLAFAVRPDRSYATIAAGGYREDGLAHVEVVDHRAGTGWLVPRLAELNRSHMPAAVVAYSRDAGASLLPQLEQAGVQVTVTSTVEYASACGHLFDQIEQAKMRHLGSPDLEAAIRGAQTRPLGEEWLWSQKGDVDITSLAACTLALWRASLGVESVYEERPLLSFSLG